MKPRFGKRKISLGKNMRESFGIFQERLDDFDLFAGLITDWIKTSESVTSKSDKSNYPHPD